MSKPDTVKVDPATLTKGPIVRDQLEGDHMSRIRTLHETFVEVFPQTLDEWVDGFKRDVHVERELQLWERMARIYRVVCIVGDGKAMDVSIKKGIFDVIVRWSVGAEPPNPGTLTVDEIAHLLKLLDS